MTVLFPFHVPIFIPRVLWDGLASALSSVRVIPKRIESSSKKGIFVRLDIPINFLTAPLIADLFLLAISAIGREEVKDGTLGTKNIFPIDIMAFFLTLAYIAISIDASGIIRWLAFKVLQKGGESGPKLFLYLYAFFFALATFIGNDPIILSGTAFLAYMTRVSSNIKHPRAWIHSQFAAANIGSAILVSSNPTNLVLAGAFGIKFIEYTANIIVPVVCTAIVLFPFLLYVVFPKEDEIPTHIEIHQLPEELLHRRAVNPNIPNARGNAEREERQNSGGDPNENLSLEEIMNPFLDKKGAGFGALIMTVTLITILALNAASQSTGEHPVFWVTLPAAFVMFCWDVAFGWRNREGTRKIARDGRAEIQRAIAAEEEEKRRLALESGQANAMVPSESHSTGPADGSYEATHLDEAGSKGKGPATDASQVSDMVAVDTKPRSANTGTSESESGATLVSIVKDSYLWCQETFPTVTAVVAHLPFALVPFAFAMFILVQALTTKGWVPVFAYGWDHWVRKTGTVGAIGGMGFLSVIMCNVGTLHSRGSSASHD